MGVMSWRGETVLLCFLIILGVSGIATPAAAASSDFEIVTTQWDSEVIQGNTYDVEITVENEGSELDTKTVTFEVGDIYRETEMTLDGGERDTWYLTIDTSSLSTGEHTQYIETPDDTSTSTVYIKAGPPEFLVGNLRAEHNGEYVSRIDRGETIDISATIFNDGEGRGNQAPTCYFAKESVGYEFMELDPSEDEDISCSVNTSDYQPGTYEYGVETNEDEWYKEIVIEKPPQGPTISSADPSGNVILNTAADESVDFEVSVSDPDSDYASISTTWSVDGTTIGNGNQIQIHAADYEPGEHTVRVEVNDNQPETESATREWTFRVVSPPEIVTQTPNQNQLTVNPDATTTFSVSADDPDTSNSALDITWRVDNDRVSSGSSYEFAASDRSPGTYTVEAVVSDGTSETKPAQESWTIEVLSPPQINDVTPTESSVQPGKSIFFSVDARDPDGPGIDTITWEIGEQTLTGADVEHTFTQTGDVDVTVTATSETGLQVTRSLELTVEAAPPELTNAGPDKSTVELGEDVHFVADATDPNGRDLTFEYQWESSTGVTADEPTTTMQFDEVGTHKIRLTVSNKYGAETTKTYTVRVRNDRPSTSRQTPSTDELGVVSQKPVRFAAQITNRDSEPATITIRVDDSVVDTFDMTGDERIVDFQHSFDAAGEKTLAIVVEDAHGEKNQVSWDVNVRSRPPEFTQVEPDDESLSLMSGDSQEFSVAATDPEGKAVSYVWTKDGSRIGTGESISHQFPESGEFDISVTASDPRGSKSNRSWDVKAQNFKTNLSQNVKLSSVTVDPSEERAVATFLSVSIENPKSNSRTAVVEFIIDTPSGVGVVRQRGVSESSLSQVSGVGEITPGEQRSMRVGLEVLDDSLIGQSIPMNITIRYYPKGQKQDVQHIQQTNQDLTIQEPGFFSSGGAASMGVLPALVAVLVSAGIMFFRSRR